MNTSKEFSDFKASSRKEVVFLNDWYLMKSPASHGGTKLALGGFTVNSAGKLEVYYSAPIIQRIDGFTLKTADGSFLVLEGFIDGKSTAENGFPHEANRLFQTGFPYTWDVLAEIYINRDATDDPMASADGSRSATMFPNKAVDIKGSSGFESQITFNHEELKCTGKGDGSSSGSTLKRKYSTFPVYHETQQAKQDNSSHFERLHMAYGEAAAGSHHDQGQTSGSSDCYSANPVKSNLGMKNLDLFDKFSYSDLKKNNTLLDNVVLEAGSTEQLSKILRTLPCLSPCAQSSCSKPFTRNALENSSSASPFLLLKEKNPPLKDSTSEGVSPFGSVKDMEKVNESNGGNSLGLAVTGNLTNIEQNAGCSVLHPTADHTWHPGKPAEDQGIWENISNTAENRSDGNQQKSPSTNLGDLQADFELRDNLGHPGEISHNGSSIAKKPVPNATGSSRARVPLESPILKGLDIPKLVVGLKLPKARRYLVQSSNSDQTKQDADGSVGAPNEVSTKEEPLQTSDFGSLMEDIIDAPKKKKRTSRRRCNLRTMKSDFIHDTDLVEQIGGDKEVSSSMVSDADISKSASRNSSLKFKSKFSSRSYNLRSQKAGACKDLGDEASTNNIGPLKSPGAAVPSATLQVKVDPELEKFASLDLSGVGSDKVYSDVNASNSSKCVSHFEEAKDTHHSQEGIHSPQVGQTSDILDKSLNCSGYLSLSCDNELKLKSRPGSKMEGEKFEHTPQASKSSHARSKPSSTKENTYNLRLSRSGRLIVPPLAHWRNEQLVYDLDGSITCILDGSKVIGRHDPGSAPAPAKRNSAAAPAKRSKK